VVNVIINVLDYNMEIQDAVDACRIDHEWMPDILKIERNKISKKIIDALKAMGHNVREIGGLGDAHSIWIDPKTGEYHGAADKRSKGTAAGY
jgi:gamma-glutamyltranspeptidase/glutathione hydrolase